MANSLTSNVTRQLAKTFLDGFESGRVITKNVDTQLLQGKFTPHSGSTTDFKRPHDYTTYRSSGGDISGITKDSIIAGKATGTVQDYFTCSVEWDDVEEALELGNLDQIIAPMSSRIITDMEVDVAEYLMQNCNLSYGDPDTSVDAWADVAGAAALCKSVGIPMDGKLSYVVNPYVAADLAAAQTAIYNDGKVGNAWETATIRNNFAGFRVFESNALKSFTTSSLSDRAGAINGTPTATYLAAKDTMTQSIPVDGFGAGSEVIYAGEIVEVTGRNRLNLSTREAIVDGGAGVKWRGVVTADVTLSGGAGTLVVAGPAIYEANGQYNTVDSALADNDVITILNGASTTYQPNLFFHKQAMGIGTVKLSKLYSTDTVATTKDGFSIRVSKYSDGDTNKQKVRFDLLPAYAMFNPFFAGQGHGV